VKIAKVLLSFYERQPDRVVMLAIVASVAFLVGRQLICGDVL
jgi:hypothetical protein